MEYIYKKYIKDLDLSDLDLTNEDEILGVNPEGHDYKTITILPKYGMYYYGECEEINIDTAIEALQKLKKAGANYVEILSHTDHHGYEFYGIEMRKATSVEISDYNDKIKIKKEIETLHKIKELEKELEQLKK